MPLYCFENGETGETIDLFFGMNDEKSYTDEDGVKWQRVFTVPNAGMDTRIDPYSAKDFLKKTEKGGTVGDLWDLSKELSEKRGGAKLDPVKKQYEKEWKKKREPALGKKARVKE